VFFQIVPVSLASFFEIVFLGVAMRIGKIIFFSFLGIALFSCTIVKNDADQKGEGGNAYAFSIGTIDPKQYANDIWESMVIPRVELMAVDFGELAAGLQSDEAGTSADMGYRLSDRNYYNFAVKGTVKLLSIDTSSASGSAPLDIYPFDGKEDCRLRIGPVLQGYALRDIQSDISPNSFVNQVDWARLATELNNKVKETVLANVDFSNMAGKEAELLGVFTYEGSGTGITITPVRMVFQD
jgi:predicted lipoprotein